MVRVDVTLGVNRPLDYTQKYLIGIALYDLVCATIDGTYTMPNGEIITPAYIKEMLANMGIYVFTQWGNEGWRQIDGTAQ